MTEISPRRRVTLLIETSNSYGRALLRGIRGWMREREPWSIRFVEQGRGANVPEWLRDWRGDGVIARVENERIAEELATLRIPVVDVSAALPDSPFPRVMTNSRMAVDLALEHLRARGLRRFAFCGDRRFHWSSVREKRFLESTRERGEESLRYSGAPARPGAEIQRIARWLRQIQPPFGLVACYDIRGQQVLEACREVGLEVPDEAAVVGIHNDELLCDLCDPPLSSVEPNALRAGFEAAEMLSMLMRGEKPEPSTCRIEPIGVVTRQSTDLVAVGDPVVARALRFIRERVCDGINVADVLREVPVARTSLEKRFRMALGRTPRQQIEEARLAKVRELLAYTTLPIARIAEQTGYQHAEYMTVAFRRSEGRTPLQYRQAHQIGSLQ